MTCPPSLFPPTTLSHMSSFSLPSHLPSLSPLCSHQDPELALSTSAAAYLEGDVDRRIEEVRHYSGRPGMVGPEVVGITI